VRDSIKRTLRRNVIYSVVVVLPFLLLSLYYSLFCSDAYLSHSQLIVERDGPASIPGVEMSLLGLGQDSSEQDALLIQQFIMSRAMLDHLQKTLNLRAHYSGENVDFRSALDSDASEEDFHRYFLKHLRVRVDSESKVITLAVDAFSPVVAQQIAEHIVARSEEFVNDISRQMAREQLEFVQAEVDAAGQRMQQAADDLIKLQRQYEVLSPEAESDTSSRILAELQGELAKARTESKALLSYLNPAASDAITARKRISALERQIEQERERQVGSKAPGVNDLMLRYQASQLNVRLSGDLYQAALKSLETIRLDASRKAKHVVRVSPPNLPDEAELPNKARNLLAAFLLLNLGYFVINLLIAVVNDHRD